MTQDIRSDRQVQATLTSAKLALRNQLAQSFEDFLIAVAGMRDSNGKMVAAYSHKEATDIMLEVIKDTLTGK